MFEIFNILITNPITNLLAAFYHILASIGIPYAFGFSIILLTCAIRLILWPFTAAQLKSAFKMQKVTPELAAIKEQYKGDNKRQQEEIMKLYKKHGVNPASGCLPVLIQFPVTISLYRVLQVAVGIHNVKSLSAINHVLYADFLRLKTVWDTTFFGLPLADSPSKLFSHMPLIVLVPVITGALQFILSKMMMPEKTLKAEEALAKATKPKDDDFQVAFQKQSMFLFPIMIGFFSFQFPIGLSLYWNTFTLFGILQQYLLVGAGSAAPYFKKINLHGRNN